MRLVFSIIVLLIAYGSLFPFEFAAADLSNFNWNTWLFTYEHQTSRGDILGNILLFIPYGFFGVLVLRDWSSTRQRMGLLLLVVSGFLFALLLQVIQLYLPSRVAAAGDAVINLAGLLLGMGAAKLLVSRLVAQWVDKDIISANLSIPFVLCACWVGYLWFPFIPSLDWQQMKNSVKHLFDLNAIGAFQLMDRLVAWSLFWYLLKKAVPATRLIYIRLFILGVIVSGEILILRNVMSLNSLIGAFVALCCITHIKRLPLSWLALGLLAWLAFRGLYPFSINTNLPSFSWIPFSGFLRGSMWYNSYVLFEKLFLYGSCFYLLFGWLGNRWLASFCLAGTLFMVELAQLLVGNHHPEITDPVIAIMLAMGLFHLDAHQSKRHELAGKGKEGASGVSDKSEVDQASGINARNTTLPDSS